MKIVVMLMLMLMLTVVATAGGEDGEYLTYDEFIREVDADNVKSVTLERFSTIRGTYLVDGEERPFHSYSEVGSASDPLLIRELKSRNIRIQVAEREEARPFWRYTLATMLFVWGVPIVTFIIVLRMSKRLTRIVTMLEPSAPVGEPTAGEPSGDA